MWNTFEDVSGQDLDWFWRSWYYETWTMDQAVAAVREVEGEWRIVVEDRGLAPMPVRLRVTFADGGEERLEVGPDAWLAGRRSTEVLVTRGEEKVIGVEIDPDRDYPDIDRSNNVWPR
jgi:aminopeptidase N